MSKIKKMTTKGTRGQQGTIEACNSFLFFCPGCENAHRFNDVTWKFNLDMDKPTLKPSYMTWWGGTVNGKFIKRKHICHSYITDGKIEFLGDCTHKLKGQTMDLPDVPGDK